MKKTTPSFRTEINTSLVLFLIILQSSSTFGLLEKKFPLFNKAKSKVVTVNEMETTIRFNSCKESNQVFNNIAIVYSDNNLDKAIEYYTKSLLLMPNNAYVLYNLAHVYLKQNKNLSAIKTYEKLLGNEDFDQDLLKFYMAFAYENEGDITRALELYKESNKFEAAFNASLILKNQGEIIAAMQEAKRAIELNKKNEKAFFNYANLNFLSGNINSAIYNLKKSLKINFAYSKVNELGYLYFLNDDLKLARKAFNQLCAEKNNNPYFISGLIGIARIDLEEGKYFECITGMQELLSMDPMHAQANKTIADAYLNIRNYKKADAHYLKAFDNGLELFAIIGLAVSNHKQGNFTKSQQFYLQIDSTETNNLSYDTQLIFGINEYQLGNRQKAKEFTDNAIKKNNKRPEAYSFLGQLQFELGEYTNAEENYKEAIKRAKNKEVYMVNLANCYVHLNNFKKAFRQFDNAIIQNSKYSKAYTGKGMCLLKLNRLPEALTAINMAIETDPSEPFNYANKSYIHASIALETTEEIKKQENLLNAMEHLRKAKKMDNTDIKIHYDNNIGLVFMELNNYDSAFAYLSKETNHVTLNNQGVLLKRKGNKADAFTKFNQSIAFNESIEGLDIYEEPKNNLGKLYAAKTDRKNKFKRKKEITEWFTYWIFLRNDVVELREHNFAKNKYSPTFMDERKIDYLFHAFISNKKQSKNGIEKNEREDVKVLPINKTAKSCPTFK